MCFIFFRPKKMLLMLFFFGFLISCSREQENVAESSGDWSVISLPDVSQQPIKLSVANVINPRFQQLTANQIKQILHRTRQMVKQYFDIDIVFSDVETIDIKKVFNSLGSVLTAERSAEIVNIDFIDKQARENMQQALFKTLSIYGDNKQNVLDYAQPYLLKPEIKQTNFIDLSYALTDTLISRLEYWNIGILEKAKRQRW